MPSTVFITGASSGLGRGLALHYAKSGATVHAAARRKDELDKLAKESPNIVPLQLDVQDTPALVKAIQRLGPLDMVIANAGIGGPPPAKKMEWGRVRRILDVNATAACRTIAAAPPAMGGRHAGHLPALSRPAGVRC